MVKKNNTENVAAETEAAVKKPTRSRKAKVVEAVVEALVAPKASVKKAPAKRGAKAAVETEVSGLKLHIAKSGQAKCARCWHHRADVGTTAAHPELCERCVENIEGAGEVRHYA